MSNSHPVEDARHPSDPKYRSLGWRLGNGLVSIFARIGLGPIALLTTFGRISGRPHTVPVVPIDHAGARWLVAPYGPVDWVHNARAGSRVSIRHGWHRDTYVPREATATEAGPVLKRYVGIASRTRQCFASESDAPIESFVAEADRHPVFELEPPDEEN